jgi:hypothetical protein
LREKILQPFVHLVSSFRVENKISEFFPSNCKPTLDKHILLLSTSVRSLMLLVLSQEQAELDQCMVFSLSHSNGVPVRLTGESLG